MLGFLKSKPKVDTAFSRFFREASSREKKKIFTEVLRRATEDQKKILDKK